MKLVSENVKGILRNSHTIESSLAVRAEWNYNRYANVESIKSGQVEDLWPDLYPIESIINPVRPQKSGIVRAFTDEDVLTGSGNTIPRYRNYVVSSDDPYKYWISPNESQRIGQTDFSYEFTFPPAPEVIYETPVYCNKIVIGVENNFVNIMHSQVQLFINNKWITIATDPDVDINGQIILYRQKFGNWTSAEKYDSPINLRGIRFVINAIDEPETLVAVIEVSPRLEVDLSDYVISTSSTEDLSDQAIIAPVGKISSNTASISLSNVDQIFNNENVDSIYYQLLDKYVKFTGDIEIAGEAIRQFTMYSQTWSGQEEAEVSVSLFDSSEIMQTITPPQLLLQDYTIGRIVSTLCDIMGYTNYNYVSHAADINQKVPYFWTTGEDSLWEVLSSLAEGTQTSIYFDAYDTMQIKSRTASFDPGRAIDWRFDAVDAGNKLADIESYSQTNEYDANVVEVKWTPTKTSDFNNGLPQMETVWSPEGTLVLRASRLTRPIVADSTHIYIPDTESTVWPFEGLVNIDSEIMRYKGKVYKYHTSPTTYKTTHVHSQEHKERLDKEESDPDVAWKNAYTGRLLITERGVFGSPVFDHSDRDLAENAFEGYVLRDGKTGGQRRTLYRITDSILNVTTNSDWDWQENFAVIGGTHKIVTRSPGQESHFGTRIRFNSGVGPEHMGEAGLFFQVLGNFSGYFVNVCTTDAVEESDRRSRNEVQIARRNPRNGNMEYLGSKGATVEIIRDKWYDIDATIVIQDDWSHMISVFVNGVLAIKMHLAGDQRVMPQYRSADGRHGVHVSSHCSVDFEYYYASFFPPTDMANYTFFDQLRGEFANGFVLRDWYNYPLYYSKREQIPYYKWMTNRSRFDDFGSYVHEIRDFDVKFEEPVLYSKLYASNDSQVVMPKYVGGPFGAEFKMVNASRNNAILEGEDNATFGADNSVNQKLFIYGRAIVREDEQSVTVRDEESIKRRGEEKTEFAGQWIQTKETAEALGEWVTKNWSKGCDEVSLKVFGNPIIELGDLVTINYPAKDLSPDIHKYFIVGINQGYTAGVETDLTLRRARIV